MRINDIQIAKQYSATDTINAKEGDVVKQVDSIRVYIVNRTKYRYTFVFFT
ncbi:MAG: hypothetical protein ACLRZ7_02600 [Lachnospiraceae bacterium]